MKILLAYCVFIIAFVILFIASIPPFADKVEDYVPSPYTYGDLYMFSNLPQFKDTMVHKDCATIISSHPKSSETIFVLGDSYVQHINTANFNVSYYKFLHWDNDAYTIAPLDHKKDNILLLETTERYLRERFKYPANGHILVGDTTSTGGKNIDHTFKLNLNVETPLTYLLTYNCVVDFFKELKAWFNWHFFDETDMNVQLSKDGKHIFFIETTDPRRITSSYNPLTDMQLDSIVQNINESYRYFQSLGFSHVYLTIIPSNVELMQLDIGNYNNLVERLEKSSRLLMPVVDLYNIFKQNPDAYYLKGDTHWSCEGRQVWLKKIDSIVYSISNKP